MNLIDFVIILILSAAIWLTAFAVKKGSIWKYVFGAAFTVYLMCAASITVFPIRFSPTIRAIFAEEGWKITDCIVLVPFKDGITADDILNVAMTVPFGVLITLIRKKTTWKTRWLRVRLSERRQNCCNWQLRRYRGFRSGISIRRI